MIILLLPARTRCELVVRACYGVADCVVLVIAAAVHCMLRVSVLKLS